MAALAISVIALVTLRLTVAAFDFYLHDTYVVIAPTHAILLFSLLCGVIAVFYFFCDRALGLRLSRGMSLAHFLLWILALLALALEAYGLSHAVQSRQAQNQTWFLHVRLTVPLLAFVSGGILFLTNVGWAIVLKLKTP